MYIPGCQKSGAFQIGIQKNRVIHIRYVEKKGPITGSAEKGGHSARSYSLQIFNAARQLSHIEAAPDKSGLVLLDYWVGLKRCLVIIHN